MPVAYAVIHEESGSFGISFPDFPGCVSGGATAEEAIRRGTEALSFHVAGMVEDGETLSSLRSLIELQADPAFQEQAEGAVLALVPYEAPGRSVRVNISMEEHLLERVDRAAEASGQSRSAFLAKAAGDAMAGRPEASPGGLSKSRSSKHLPNVRSSRGAKRKSKRMV